MASQVADGHDYYQVLEVAQDASHDDIRKAYRRLARQYHPDVNGGNAEATERFKAINQAYEVLSDPDKRARYDRFGPAGVDPQAGGGDFGVGGFGSFGDIFDVIFGQTARGAPTEVGPERGADLRDDLEIPLEEVLTGAKKPISVTRLETCTECEGNGARPGTRPQPCAACAGSGYVRSSRQTIFGT